MQKFILIFKYAIFSVLVCCQFFCSIVSEQVNEEVSFTVVDVGQGLSQISVRNGRAVVWDMGHGKSYSMWHDRYIQEGSPYIEAIVISHGDLDHVGGLYSLSEGIDFSGLIIVSPFEDTAQIRKNTPIWSSKIKFRIIKQGDTLALLPDVNVKCLWPPDSVNLKPNAHSEFDKNRYSFCFMMTFGLSSILITSDIDTFVQERLCQQYKFELNADVIVVPHHGSKSALHAVFYGYVHPNRAIVSCGLGNPYNHPSEDVIRFLAFQMGVVIDDTRYDRHVFGVSNGEYWVW